MNILNLIIEAFSQDFFLKAFIAGLLIALPAALLGNILVLKQFSMIGDGLSHINYGSACFALAFGVSPYYISIPVCCIASILLLIFSGKEKSGIKGDAFIAVCSASALAFGNIIISLSSVKFDISSYMFGSLLSLSETEVALSAILSGVVTLLFVLFFARIFSVTFDENFSKASGLKVKKYNLLIAILTAIVTVVGMKLMGALLISGLIIFPALTSMKIFSSFKSACIFSALGGICSSAIGIILCYIYPVPASACIIAVNFFMYIISFVISKLKWKV